MDEPEQKKENATVYQAIVCLMIGLAFGSGYLFAKISTKNRESTMAAPTCDTLLSCIDAKAAKHESIKKNLQLTFYDTLVGKKATAHDRLEMSLVEKPLPPAPLPEIVKNTTTATKSRIVETLARVLGDETPQSVRSTIEHSIRTSTGSPFAVQVASLPDLKAAENLAASLKAKGYPAQVVQAELGTKGKVFRVRLHGYQTREQADVAREEFEKKQRTNVITVQQ